MSLISKRPLASVKDGYERAGATAAPSIGSCVSALTTVPTTFAGSHSGWSSYLTVVSSPALIVTVFACGQ